MDAHDAAQRSESKLAECMRQLAEQAAHIQSLQADAAANAENASLFKAEQERCMTLTAELHTLQTQSSAAAAAADKEVLQLRADLGAEAKKTQLLKVCIWQSARGLLGSP